MGIKTELLLGVFFLSLNIILGIFYLKVESHIIVYTLFMSIFPILLISNPTFLRDYFKSDDTSRILGWIGVIILYAHLFVVYPMQDSDYFWNQLSDEQKKQLREKSEEE